MKQPDNLINLLANQSEYLKSLKDEEFLFHFTSTDTAIKHILCEKQLKLNSFKNMNDPWECKNFDHYYQNMDIEKSPEIFKKEEEINKIKSYSKIASFCTNEPPNIVTIEIDPQSNCTINKLKKVKDKYSRFAFERSRMWNQYANNHKGVCIVFSKESLIESFQKQFYGKMLYSDYLKYSPQYSYFQEGLTLDCDELLKLNNDVFIKKYIKSKKDYIFFSKNIDYRDESEFRIVVYDSDNNCNFLNIKDCIRGIIIGVDCHNCEIKCIKDFCENLGISCAVMDWRNGEPEPWSIME
jgi:hypothetical protein